MKPRRRWVRHYYDYESRCVMWQRRLFSHIYPPVKVIPVISPLIRPPPHQGGEIR